MKKIILMAVAILSMGTAFAGNGEAKAIREMASNVTANYGRLAQVLNLTTEQYEVVGIIQENFRDDMRSASFASSEKRQERFEKALRRDLNCMHSVLTQKQYRTYLTLLNLTLVNKGLI